MNEVDITGFSEISQSRLNYKGDGFWYCEIAVTGSCNFSCKYCNRLQSHINLEEVLKFIYQYSNSLKHVQITGGEPTLYDSLGEICRFIKSNKIKLGISTNGSADLDFYKSLEADMFSISLDDYNYEILTQRGYKDCDKVISNIKELSKVTYVNVGVVIDSLNVSRISKIIDFILGLGVDDIKLSVSTKNEVSPSFNDDEDYSAYPILNYRVERFRAGKKMRGMLEGDNFKCRISENDITIVGRSQYPCLVYAREGGKPIGLLDSCVRTDRLEWVKRHDPKNDPICKKYCMDFKCAFNRAANFLT